jgi:hypothetical protein
MNNIEIVFLIIAKIFHTKVINNIVTAPQKTFVPRKKPLTFLISDTTIVVI